MNVKILILDVKDFIIRRIRNFCFLIGSDLVAFANRNPSIEDLMVENVMAGVQELIDACPFRYLLVSSPIAIPNKPDMQVVYIIKDGKLYEDHRNNIVNSKISHDVDLDKYCFKFDGKPRSFLDLEHYQFVYINFDLIKKYVRDSITAKKVIYRI